MSPVDYSHTPALLSLREFEQAEVPPELILSDGVLELYESAIGRNVLSVQSRPGVHILQAGGLVGVIPINPRLTLEVRPRVPVSNLLRLLRLADYVPQHLDRAYRRYAIGEEDVPTLLGVYGRSLVAYLDDILDRGLLKEYRQREAVTSHPRGRILVGHTITAAAARGRSDQVAVSWFERTADTGPNRCLKDVVWLLLLCIKGDRGLVRSLNRLYQQLSAIALDLSCSFLQDPVVSGTTRLPRLRSYYHEPLQLALAIIRHQAIDVDRAGDALRLPSVLVDMSDVFESYLRHVLQVASSEQGWDAMVLDGNKLQPGGGGKTLFDFGAGDRAAPDIVLSAGSGATSTVPVVIDAKYKPARGGPTRDDVNQAIAYAVSYRAPAAVIVQPRDADPSERDAGIRLHGSVAGIDVHQYVLDMAAPLASEEQRFCAAIQALSKRTSTAPAKDDLSQSTP
jgi:5-methylcytosine-specific restriction enzyme subunit McrC